MNIQVIPKQTEGVERRLEIKVPVEEVRQAEEKAARRYASRVRVPGFRPGKAPPAVVLKRYADAIRQEALESLVQAAYQKVVESEQLKLASQPHVHDLKFAEGEPLTFELHLEVRPEIQLNRTHGFRVTRTVRPVTDEQVQEQLEALHEQRAALVPVAEKPREHDLVTVVLASAGTGEAVPEGKQYHLVLGAGQAIPGIEELIMSVAPGETVERPVRWPDDFPDETQRGVTKTVRVTLEEVKRKVLPELDDAFARELGSFESLEALRQAIRSDLQKEAEREAEAEVRQKLLDEIIGANPFDVPPSWVSQLANAYAELYRVPEAERERFVSQFRPVAERQVRRDLVIETLAEREGLTATEADLDRRIEELARQRGTDPAKLYASLQKSGRLKEIERGITEEKVFAWLLERNTVE
ncbi:MAG TPA: trigger factor [Gemmatimonadaceae bacterium]|nr:trigger factor [Gemmatimonadaceae bacterium]